MKTSTQGYKRTSPDKNEKTLRIPSNRITMKGVDFPIKAQSSNGLETIMHPGMGDYYFPGAEYVIETPIKDTPADLYIKKEGGQWLDKYQDGGTASGPRIENLPKEEFKPTPNLPVNPVVNQGYIKRRVPGASGSMMTVYEKPGETPVVLPKEQAKQAAITERVNSNNIDPIGLGVLAAAGAGPLVRSVGAALPYLDAPAVLPYVGEVPWLTANNIANAGFAANSINQVANSNSDLRTNPNATNVAETALGFVGLPYKTGALSFADDVSRAGKFLTEETALRNAYKLNPKAGKLSKYNRVVGQDAIDDLQTSGLVRTGQGAGPTGRPTLYPSFAKGNPRQTYIDQVLESGQTPHIISTDRPMRVSTLGRHGKGTTQFPVDDAGNYMTSFPASETKVFDGTQPHWLRGYKQINKPERISANEPNLIDIINEKHDLLDFKLKSLPETSKQDEIFNSFLSGQKKQGGWLDQYK